MQKVQRDIQQARSGHGVLKAAASGDVSADRIVSGRTVGGRNFGKFFDIERASNESLRVASRDDATGGQLWCVCTERRDRHGYKAYPDHDDKIFSSHRRPLEPLWLVHLLLVQSRKQSLIKLAHLRWKSCQQLFTFSTRNASTLTDNSMSDFIPQTLGFYRKFPPLAFEQIIH